MSPFVMNVNGNIQLFYYNNAKILRHAWTDSQGWHFEDLDGSTASISHRAADVGMNIGGTQYGNTLQLFYYDNSGGNLRHSWSDTTGWHFEDLDGTTGSIARASADYDIGYSPTATVYISSTASLQLFYFDRSSQLLRHAWTDATGWHFENLTFTVIY